MKDNGPETFYQTPFEFRSYGHIRNQTFFYFTLFCLLAYFPKLNSTTKTRLPIIASLAFQVMVSTLPNKSVFFQQ